MNYVKLLIRVPYMLPYELVISRKYTVIQGMSGTGKTTLLDMLEDSEMSVKSVPYNLTVETPRLRRKTSRDDIVRILNSYISVRFGTVFVFDEDSSVILTSQFQEAIQLVDAYFVIICRSPLHNLPYGVDNLYEIVNKGNYIAISPRYSKLPRDFPISKSNQFDMICTEDSCAGYRLLSFRTKCVKAGHGKDKVVDIMKQSNKTCFIVDGVGFGANIAEALDNIGTNTLIVTESFEGNLCSAITNFGAFGSKVQIENVDYLHASNLEVAIEDNLRHALKSFRIYRPQGDICPLLYKKTELPKCLTDRCLSHMFCVKTSQVNHCALERDWLSYIYPQVVVDFVASHPLENQASTTTEPKSFAFKN